MKKKIFAIAASLFLIILGLFYFSTITLGIENEIHISSPINQVVVQFTDLRNWKNWYPGLRNRDTSSFVYSETTTAVNSFLLTGAKKYTIIKINPAAVVVEFDTNGKKLYHSLFAFPDSFGMATQVHWRESLTTINWLKEKLQPTKQIERDLNELKAFSEDPKKYYGFRIEIQHVTDSIVLTKETTTTKNSQSAILRKLYNEIRQYAKAKHIYININGPKIAKFYQKSYDSVQIFAGIPVTKKGPNEKSIHCLEMPSEGKMLVGYYEGPYPGLPNLYKAMEKYIADKNLKKISAEYEKYYGNPLSPEDSLHMKIEIHYPIL